VNPPNDQQLLLIAIVEELFFIQGLACIAGAGLLRDDEARDEHGVGL
jgi:hypothetical protein